jgi:hypothetical protein
MEANLVQPEQIQQAIHAPDDKDAHAVAYGPVEEMIGETFEVGPPQVGFV